MNSVFGAGVFVVSLLVSLTLIADDFSSSLRYRPSFRPHYQPPHYYTPYYHSPTYYPSPSYNYPASSPSPTPSAVPSMADVYKYKTSLGPYGEYLSSYTGKAIYIFSKDERGGPSRCYDQCAQDWIPIIIPQDQYPKAYENAFQDYLGKFQRTDGNYQLTYNGWPLYYYKYDQNDTDYNGFKKDAYGGTWYLVRPNGSWMQ